MEKRNKQWRKRHQWRVFKARLILLAACQCGDLITEDGKLIQHPHWTDFVSQKWCLKYKTMRTPCSCYLCKGESYSRLKYKKETSLILSETLDTHPD